MKKEITVGLSVVDILDLSNTLSVFLCSLLSSHLSSRHHKPHRQHHQHVILIVIHQYNSFYLSLLCYKTLLTNKRPSSMIERTLKDA